MPPVTLVVVLVVMVDDGVALADQEVVEDTLGEVEGGAGEVEVEEVRWRSGKGGVLLRRDLLVWFTWEGMAEENVFHIT